MSTTKTDQQAQSVIRALDHHRDRGAIRGWRRNEAAPWKRGGTERPFYLLVDLAGNTRAPDGTGTIELKTLREAVVFVTALASADHASRSN